MGPGHHGENHMFGCHVAFMKIYTTVPDLMRFSDDSVARIKGCGTIMFMCKNGESQSFDRVLHPSSNNQHHECWSTR
jgi:hypothetical protein